MMLNRSLFTQTQRLSGLRCLSSSVNPEEISKFGKIGSQWWDSESTSGAGPLHAMNPVRLHYIRESIATILGRTSLPPIKALSGLRVLDVGCGGGLLSEGLTRLKPKEVWALDPSPENIEVARAHQQGILEDDLSIPVSEVVGGHAVQYYNTTVETLSAFVRSPATDFSAFIQAQTQGQTDANTESLPPQESKQFDVICSLEVIEHVENPGAFLQHCIACLKPGGSFFVSTMNRTAKAKLITVLAAEYLLKVVPIGTHDWEKYLSPQELSVLMGPQMQLVSQKGLILTPFGSNLSLLGSKPSLPNLVDGLKNGYNWVLSDTDLDVNYIMHFKKEESSA